MNGCAVCGQKHERCKGHKMRYDGTPLRPCKKYPVRGQELCHTCDAKERIAWASGQGPLPRSLNSREAAFVRKREKPKPRERQRRGPAVDEFGLCSRCNDFHNGCTAHNRSTGAPCGFSPMAGLTVCWRHGGRNPHAKAKSERVKRHRELVRLIEKHTPAVMASAARLTEDGADDD